MRRLIAVAASGLLLALAPGVHAASRTPRTVAAATDPARPVYVVISADSYRKLPGLLSKAGMRRGPLGESLVVAQSREGWLPEIALRLHQRELRCGGYFAFETQAEAERFIATDGSLRALARGLTTAYSVDNQATVQPWLPQVGESNVRTTIQALSAYPNRHYATTNGARSANWIASQWRALANGRSDVATELFSCTTCGTQPSVILTIRGNELANEVVVLGAHLDSISSSGTGEAMSAPGADDDASGIATLTEVLRVALAGGWRPQRTVKFMGYAAEEVGLRGSNAIAQSFKAAGVNVHGVLQLDMTNWRVGGEDMRIISDYSNPELKAFFAQLFDTYLAPTGLVRGSFACGYACSDHASWTSAGFPSAMMFEGGTGFGNPNIHKTTDTLANMQDSAANAVKFGKFGLAFLGEMAKTSAIQTYANGTDVPTVDLAAVESGVSVAGRSGTAGNAVAVRVDIVHDFIGDLVVSLVASDGTEILLHNREGGSADDIHRTYAVDLSGKPLNGAWTLRVRDFAKDDAGYLDGWSVTF